MIIIKKTDNYKKIVSKIFHKHIFLVLAIILPIAYIFMLAMREFFSELLIGFMGLFVPFGVFNIVYGGWYWMVYIPVIFIIDYCIGRCRCDFWIKVVLSIVILFIVTIFVDYLIWGGWESLNLLD